MSPASTPSQELEQRSKIFMLLALHGLPDDYTHVRDQILGSPIVPNFTSICFTLLRVPSKHTTDRPINFVDDSSALVSQRDDHTHPRKPSKRRLTIMANLATKLTGVMLYMVALLNLQQLHKLLFLCNLILWILFHLIHQATLLFSINFLNGMRIIKTLVPLLLLHIQLIQLHLLLPSLTPILLVLGF